MAHSSRKSGGRQSRRVASPARSDVEALVYRWGPRIDPDLLDLSLTHRSFAHENGGLPTNERLEFLGDSVLSIVVTENLYRAHPDAPEGHAHEVVDPRWSALAGLFDGDAGGGDEAPGGAVGDAGGGGTGDGGHDGAGEGGGVVGDGEVRA